MRFASFLAIPISTHICSAEPLVSSSPEVVEKYFVPHLTNAKIVTSEISQVPLAGVRSLFEAAGKRKILRFLDMDLPSSVAVGPANLGSQADVTPSSRHQL